MFLDEKYGEKEVYKIFVKYLFNNPEGKNILIKNVLRRINMNSLINHFFMHCELQYNRLYYISIHCNQMLKANTAQLPIYYF